MYTCIYPEQGSCYCHTQCVCRNIEVVRGLVHILWRVVRWFCVRSQRTIDEQHAAVVVPVAPRSPRRNMVDIFSSGRHLKCGLSTMVPRTLRREAAVHNPLRKGTVHSPLLRGGIVHTLRLDSAVHTPLLWGAVPVWGRPSVWRRNIMVYIFSSGRHLKFLHVYSLSPATTKKLKKASVACSPTRRPHFRRTS